MKVQKPNEEVRGLAADPIRKTYWVYTDQTIFELRKDNEDRDIWKTYMAKGKYDFALKYAKVCVCLFPFSGTELTPT
jgi:hypothetical protein